MEIELPNGNYLPLPCKALYRFDHTGIGVKFTDITQFEQELISKIIAARLDEEGVPLQIDPFHQPPTFIDEESLPNVDEIREKTEAMLDRVMGADKDQPELISLSGARKMDPGT